MKIVRDDFEIVRARAWAEEGLPENDGYFSARSPDYGEGYDQGFDEGYAQGIAAVLDWLTGDTNISPDR